MATCTVTGGRLNVRALKSTTSTKLGYLDDGTQVNVVCCDNTWATLQFNGTPAFVMSAYLNGEPTTKGDGLSTGDSAKTNVSGLNVRTGPGLTNSTTGSQLSKGVNVTIESRSYNSSEGYYWYRINTSTPERWVRGDFLAPSESGGSSGALQAGHYVQVSSTTVNVRASTSTSSTRLGILRNGTKMYCEDVVSSSWVKIRWGGKSQTYAYIMSNYLIDGGVAPSSKMQRAIDIGLSMARQGYPDEPEEYFDIGYGKWCVRYVSFLQKAAGCSSSNYVPFSDAYVSEAVAFYQGKGTFGLLGAKTPAKGDLVFYRLGSESFQHVGLVVDTDGIFIDTVEGNMGLTVDFREDADSLGNIGNMTVYGFGTPTWS